MPKRRAKGEGNLRKRKDGLWECSITIGVTDNGYPKRRSVYGKTQAEVLEKSARLRADYHRGLLADVDKRTFKDFANEWLERKSRGKAANTKQNYHHELEYAFTSIGSLRLQAVKPTHVRTMIEMLIKDGYASRTVKKVLQRVRAVFKDALGLELIHRNPAEAVSVDLPPSEPIGKSLEAVEVSNTDSDNKVTIRYGTTSDSLKGAT
jgi:Phage integrase, N-terminal SAM-like domain